MLPLLCLLCAPRHGRTGHRCEGASVSSPLSKLLQQRRRYNRFGPVLSDSSGVSAPHCHQVASGLQVIACGVCVSHLSVIYMFSLMLSVALGCTRNYSQITYLFLSLHVLGWLAQWWWFFCHCSLQI